MAIQMLDYIGNALFQKNLIKEIQSENDFIYVLSDQTSFSSTEYKIVNGNENDYLIKCKKIKFNGKAALCYLAKNHKSLDVMMPVLEEGRFLHVVESIFSQLEVIKNNSFLANTAIDMRMERIFINRDNGVASFTYIPISDRCYTDGMYMEQDLRVCLANAISASTKLNSEQMRVLAGRLLDPRCSFSDIKNEVSRIRMQNRRG